MTASSHDRVRIRRAVEADTDAVLAIGLDAPELQVSNTAAFMGRDELRWSIEHEGGVFLVAEVDGAIVGFLFANTADIEVPHADRCAYACLVYLVAVPAMRRMGIAQQLYTAAEHILRERGIASLFAWASVEGDGSIVAFLQRQGFVEGHRYVWMDKELSAHAEHEDA